MERVNDGAGARRRTRAKLTGAATAVIALAAIAGATSAHAHTDAVGDELARARAATARYHDEDVAAADGFTRENHCLSSPAGAMGFHHPNRARMDGIVSVSEPEILLYAPRADGGRRLVGVEYWKPDADQNLATAGDRPSLFGAAFDGPMPGHTPGMPIHYDLHVWLWQANPLGMFAPFNPNVGC